MEYNQIRTNMQSNSIFTMNCTEMLHILQKCVDFLARINVHVETCAKYLIIANLTFPSSCSSSNTNHKINQQGVISAPMQMGKRCTRLTDFPPKLRQKTLQLFQRFLLL